jgi:NAD+ synthase
MAVRPTEPNQNFKKISKTIERFISSYVAKSGSKGLVIGLSGGLDSAVVLKLSVNALGPSKVLGLLLPSEVTPGEDTQHAIDHAKSLETRYQIIDINPIIAKYAEVLPQDKMARANLTSRLRMNILYYYAAINDYLVAGTSDKSEFYIGYFAKFGDGAADIMPIADLYKTEVRALGKYLDIPSVILQKKSSPGLWVNHLAEEELGMDYETIDPILHMLVDKKLKPDLVARKLAVSIDQIRKVKKMIDKNAHKRKMPPIAYL